MVTQQLQERLKRLYNEMVRQGNLCTGKYKTDEFPYVTVPSGMAPEGIIAQYGSAFGLTIASQSEQRTMAFEAALGHCETYTKICKDRKRLMFVASDLVPEEFRNPCAVHMYIQGYYELAFKKAACAHATRAEFEQAELQGLGFLVHYTRWWMETLHEKLKNSPKTELEALKKLLPLTSAIILRDAGYL